MRILHLLGIQTKLAKLAAHQSSMRSVFNLRADKNKQRPAVTDKQKLSTVPVTQGQSRRKPGEPKVRRGVGDYQRNARVTVEKVRRQLGKSRDRTEENIQKLYALSQTPVDEKLAKKILEHVKRPGHVTKLDVDYVEPTLFSEEDFAKFQAEYLDGGSD